MIGRIEVEHVALQRPEHLAKPRLRRRLLRRQRVRRVLDETLVLEHQGDVLIAGDEPGGFVGGQGQTVDRGFVAQAGGEGERGGLESGVGKIDRGGGEGGGGGGEGEEGDGGAPIAGGGGNVGKDT